MSQTKEGAIKLAAQKTGVSVDQYKKNIQYGLLWCTGCKEWHKKGDFTYNKNRWSGRAHSCRDHIKREYRKNFKPIAPENRKRKGPLPGDERPGDKKQARHRVNVFVRTGKIPQPNDIECSDCGHIYKKGEIRHEYDHYKGYAIGNHTIVIALCSECHHRRHPRNATN